MQSKIRKPIIILGCPRSGTTLLFTLLNSHPELFSLYEESRFIFHKFYQEKLRQGISFKDDALVPEDFSQAELEDLVNNFHCYSFKNRNLGLLFNKIIRKKAILKNFAPYLADLNGLIKDNIYKEYRLVEKTPRNCFKVKLLNKLFPDAKFIFLRRDYRTNISSLIEGWKNRQTKYSGESKRLPKMNQMLSLTNFDSDSWRFVLPPGYQDYISKSLEELCAFQWMQSIDYILNDLQAIDKERQLIINYEDLVEKTPELLKGICNFAELDFTKDLQKLATKPPEVNYLDSRPNKDKWKKNQTAIERIEPMIEATRLRLQSIDLGSL